MSKCLKQRNSVLTLLYELRLKVLTGAKSSTFSFLESSNVGDVRENNYNCSFTSNDQKNFVTITKVGIRLNLPNLAGQ
jgi:hypothetical protein